MDNDKKSDQARGECLFRLHYFPEIPTRFEEKERPEETQPSRRHAFQKIDSLCAAHNNIDLENAEIEARKASEMQQMMERAFQEGYAKGITEGKAAERERLTPCVQSIEALVNDFETVKRRLTEEAETAVVKLALRIAGKVLHTESKIRPETVLAVASAALKKVMDPNRITLRINPRDMDLLEQHRRDLQEIVGGKQAIRLESDSDIAPGGCFIETDFGDIDARIDSQLKAIEDALKSEWIQSVKGDS